MIHLRSYAQKKPIDEYKQEAFLLFERLLVSIREEVTRILMQAQVQLEPHRRRCCPTSSPSTSTRSPGEDDTADIDAGDRLAAGRMPCSTSRSRRCRCAMTAGGVVEAPVSRNAPCPCGSGKKYKHCHGQPA